jgi:hypothetical protein
MKVWVIWIFGNWDLFGAWDFVIGISRVAIKQIFKKLSFFEAANGNVRCDTNGSSV